MHNLFDSLVTKFNADDELGGTAAFKLYLNKAESDDATFPYFVFFLINAVPLYDTNYTKPVEEVNIQFNIYSDHNEAVEVADLYEHLIANFDYCSLTVSGYTHLEMRRTMQTLIKDEFNYWTYSIMYKILIQKS